MKQLRPNKWFSDAIMNLKAFQKHELNSLFSIFVGEVIYRGMHNIDKPCKSTCIPVEVSQGVVLKETA